MAKPLAVIIGAGDGLSASLARELAVDHDLTLLARSGEKMRDVAKETGARTVIADATDESAIAAVFDDLPEPPRVVVYNPSARVRGPIAELSADAVRNAVEVTAIGAFLAGKHAARRMLEADPIDGKRGTILFTGASAGVKGFPLSAPFAMGKFASAASPRVCRGNCIPRASTSSGSTSTERSSIPAAPNPPKTRGLCSDQTRLPAPIDI